MSDSLFGSIGESADPELVVSARVFGVGIGTLLVVIFGILYFGLCCFGCFLQRPFSLYATATLIYGTLLIIVFSAKRSSPWKDDAEIQKEIDPFWYPRLFIVIVMTLAALCSVYAVTTRHLFRPLSAKEINNYNASQGIHSGKRQVF